MKTILITGGNGFLGSNIAKSIINKYNVIVLVRKTDNLYRLTSIKSKLKIYSVLKDKLETIFQENFIDIIIHTATIYGRDTDSIENIISTNFLLPINLLQLGIQYNVPVFVNTDTVLDSKVSYYALTKSNTRDWLRMFSENIKIINVQLEHFYGPGGGKENFISWIILKFLKNVNEVELTKGEQTRDFLFIDDATSAFLTILNNLNSLNNNYSNIQISSGELITIKNLVELIKKMTGSDTILNFGAIPYRFNELMECKTDNSLLKSFGWKPSVDIVEGITRTIDHLNSSKDYQKD